MPQRTVSTRVVPVVFTVPAGTTAAAPLTQTLDLGMAILDSLRVRIPPGPSGLTGFAMTLAGTRIVPWGGAADWFIGDDETEVFPVDIEVGNGLQLVGFNTDVFDHAFYLLATVTDLGTGDQLTPAVAPLAL